MIAKFSEFINGIEFGDIISVLAFLLSVCNSVCLIYSRRRSVKVIVRDACTYNGSTYLSIDLINRSHLNIVIYSIYIGQYEAQHYSRTVYGKYVLTQDGDRTRKSFETLSFPITLSGLDAVGGIVRLADCNAVVNPGKVTISLHTGRGKIKRTLRFETNGEIIEQISYKSQKG